MKSIEEITKELTSIEKVQTLISMTDIPMGQEKISQGYNPLGSIPKRRLPNQPPTRINTNIQTIPNIYTYIIFIREYM